MIASGYT